MHCGFFDFSYRIANAHIKYVETLEIIVYGIAIFLIL